MKLEDLILSSNLYVSLLLTNPKEIEIGYYIALIELNEILARDNIQAIKA